MQNDTHETFVSVKQISTRYNIGVASVWRWAQDKDNKFPKPIKLSQGCTRWKESDLLKWESEK